MLVRETVSLIGLPGGDHSKRHQYRRCTDCGNIAMSEKAIPAPWPCRCGSIEFEIVWNATLLNPAAGAVAGLRARIYTQHG